MSEKSSFVKCKECKEYHWTNEKCAPIFYFKHEWWGEEFQEIRAYTFEEAARNFAEKYNEDDNILLNSNTKVIISDGKKEIEYEVFAELDIFYWSRKVN